MFNIHDLVIFILYNTCYNNLFHDHTFIYIQHEKNKDTYNVSFSTIEYLTEKIYFVMQVHFTRHPWQAWLQIFQNGLNK